MQKKILDFLCCPTCKKDFIFEGTKQFSDEAVENGALFCDNCRKRYPIVDGIPRILPENLSCAEKKTISSFRFAWKHYGALLSRNLNSEFLSLVNPWREEDFKDKIVLDVGCGAGRLSRLASEYGAKEVFSIDFSQAVEAAKELSSNYPNIHFFQTDLFNLPFKKKFDIVFSLGVLHHTTDPHLAFKNILEFLKDKGKIGIWVYGKEGNEGMKVFINALRIITTKLNDEKRVFISRSMVKAGEAIYKLISRFSENIFYREYLKYFNTSLNNFDRQYVVFDFLSTYLVKYISRKELENWASEQNLTDVLIVRRNANSWGLTARKNG